MPNIFGASLVAIMPLGIGVSGGIIGGGGGTLEDPGGVIPDGPSPTTPESSPTPSTPPLIVPPHDWVGGPGEM